MSKPIYVLNGPNLNLLGEREPHIYGSEKLSDVEQRCLARSKALGHSIVFFQSNYEGALVEKLHEARRDACGVIINPAGYTFTSVAIMDALKMFDGPKIELHISNVHRREKVYHNSLMSAVVTTVIAGAGTFGYEIAIETIVDLVRSGKS